MLSLGADLILGDRYRLEQPIGRGGMGEVWRATDLRLRRPVAIKVLPSDRGSDRQSVARFRREAETAAASQHPGITVVFDIDVHRDTAGETVFLVMELLDGKDLRAVARHRAACRSPRRSRTRRRSPTRWPRRTRGASCTATSSRRT